MSTPIRDNRPAGAPREAAMSDYLKEAFLFRWNLLFLLGGTAAAALTPLATVLLPLVAAGELTYLTGLVSVPRFRAAIDAKVHAAGKGAPAATAAPPPAVSLVAMLKGLPADARTRFERLHARCLEMRGIAAGVRGAAGDQGGTAEEIRATGIQWAFGPCVTVPQDIRWGRTYEGFSEDPKLVRELAGPAVRTQTIRLADKYHRHGRPRHDEPARDGHGR